MDEAIDVGPPPRNRRRVLVLVGVAAAVVIGAVVLPGALFGAGGSPSTSEAFPPAVTEPGATPAATNPGEAPPAETFEPFTSKNPFRPLVDLGGSTGTGDAAIPVETTPPTLPIDPLAFVPSETFLPDVSLDPGVVTDTVSDTTATTVATPPVRPPDRVSLLEVFTDLAGQPVASVRVNDITYLVAPGGEFATSYRVVDLDTETRCGQLLFGDDRFELCEGDEVLKTIVG